MSNKNLLNESTIRKFMKLANMEPLAEEFVSTHLQEDEEVDLEEDMHAKKDDDDKEDVEEGMHGKKDEDDKEDVEEGMHGKKDEEEEEKVDEMGGYMAKDDMDEEPMDMDDEPMDDMGDMDDDMGGDAEVTLDEEDVQALKSALEAAQSVMDKLAGGLGGDEPEMDDEPMDDLDLDEPEMDDPAGRDEMMEEEELEEEDLGIDLVDENELVAEVLKKVLNRLAKKA